MGVLELIQQKAFLGKEFLTWLWFRGEREGGLDVGKAGRIEIELLGPILLDAAYGDARASTLRGDSPATSPEAKTALLEGKKLKRARLKLARGQAEWTFTLDGENFNVSGLAIPRAGKLPFEDQAALRMEMLLEFDQVLQSLLETFLELRLDDTLWGKELPLIHAWVRDK